MNRTTFVQSGAWFYSPLTAIRSVLSKTRAGNGSFGATRVALLIFAFLLALYPDVFLGTHSLFYRDFGFFAYPLAHYHLGQAYQLKGDIASARDEYQRFLQVWRDADADIPYIITAKRFLAN